MASSLSSFVNNLSEGLHRIKCKLGNDDRKCETCGNVEINASIVTVFLNTKTLKMI